MGSIDIEALREKLAKIAEEGARKSAVSFSDTYLQLQDGENIVRILPAKDEGKVFYAEIHRHNVTINGQPQNFHCLWKVAGEPCPLCMVVKELYNTGREEDKKLASRIRAKPRYFMNVVDRRDNSVRILSSGPELFLKRIATQMVDEDYNAEVDGEKHDPISLLHGNDLKIIKSKEKERISFAQSTFRPAKSPAGKPAEIARWMDSLHDIYSLVRREDPEAVKQAACVIANIPYISPEEQEQGKKEKTSKPEVQETDTEKYLDEIKTEVS